MPHDKIISSGIFLYGLCEMMYLNNVAIFYVSSIDWKLHTYFIGTLYCYRFYLCLFGTSPKTKIKSCVIQNKYDSFLCRTQRKIFLEMSQIVLKQW